MITVNSYLTFNGTCEAAFNFYKSVFGGEFAYVGRYKDMPSEQPMSDADKDKIMHIYLPLGEGTALMGADAVGDNCGFDGGKVTVGNNITLSINTTSEEEARRVFGALSAGGKVTMPMETTFWGALFGMCVDKFGINWMISFEQEKK